MDQLDLTSPCWAHLFRWIVARLAPSTKQSYTARKEKYLEFCRNTGVSPVPVTKNGLMHSVAYAFRQGLKHQMIKSYLSAIRHLQVSCGEGDPNMSEMPQLGFTLRGVKKEHVASQNAPTSQSPIIYAQHAEGVRKGHIQLRTISCSRQPAALASFSLVSFGHENWWPQRPRPTLVVWGHHR